MSMLVKLIGSGIGLASEAISARKAAKSSSVSPLAESSSTAVPRRPIDEAQGPPQYVELPRGQAETLIAQGMAVPADESVEFVEDDEEGDEELWELDDATTPLAESPSEEKMPQDPNLLADTFMRTHPPPAYTPSKPGARPQLPCPVIIPQRRPRDKKRGFVRAYAPVLEDCGIDQIAFMEFLKTFHQACKESPWLQVVNIGAAAAGFVPSAIAMGVSTAVQVAVGIAMEVQRRTRTNSFLERVNEDFFKPRGLYCLIMTYKPEDSALHERVDIAQAIDKYSVADSSKIRQTFKNLRLSSGKSYGELELPEAAPLVFPALEALATDESVEGIERQNKMKSGHKWVADYFDRRAQAAYAAENPGRLAMAQPQPPKFAGRFANPNHPANSGSLVSLITGGHVNPTSRRTRRRGVQELKALRRGEPLPSQTGKSKEHIMKRVLKRDVLYLMIVNLPSEPELQTGRDIVASEAATS